jgi:hypothetical protein
MQAERAERQPIERVQREPIAQSHMCTREGGRSPTAIVARREPL